MTTRRRRQDKVCHSGHQPRRSSAEDHGNVAIPAPAAPRRMSKTTPCQRDKAKGDEEQSSSPQQRWSKHIKDVQHPGPRITRVTIEKKVYGDEHVSQVYSELQKHTDGCGKTSTHMLMRKTSANKVKSYLRTHPNAKRRCTLRYSIGEYHLAQCSLWP